ncbi:MAG TPA: hypothetical protein VHB21_18255 [Minicystis sp.]|nr:hypothetical protein [Minicystis sp.]
MALTRLGTDEMIQISAAWTAKESPARKALLAVPELAAVLPRLEAAHAALAAGVPSAANPRLAAIAAEEAAIDERHDAIVRGTDLVLEGLGLLAGPGPRADALKAARDTLTPTGMGVIATSYRAEAGAAQLLAMRLERLPAVKATLETVLVDRGKSLLDATRERIQKAAALGKLEDERAALGAKPASAAADGAALRSHWVRAVNALVANAELAELPAAAHALVFGALREAEKKADERADGHVEGAR